MLGQIESILALAQRVQAMLSGLAYAGFEQQEAAAGYMTSPDTAAQLMQLGQSQTFCVFNKHMCGIRHIDANLYHGSGHQ